MGEFTVEQFRGETVESVHRVSGAVVTPDGNLVGSVGTPDLVTFLRSAAKPIQVIPFVESGAADAAGVTEAEIALACASHNSEIGQVAIVEGFLARLDLDAGALACGPHPSLYYELGRFQGRGVPKPEIAPPSVIANNCSGKHTAMLGHAVFQGWAPAGYHEAGHPVQKKCLKEVAERSALRENQVKTATDGCGVQTFALPLRNMALLYAGLVAAPGGTEKRIVDAMMAYPDLVAGSHRLCTALMKAYPGQLIAKVGAGGVYLVGLVEQGIGIALKAEDGNAHAAEIALVTILRDMGLNPGSPENLRFFSSQSILNTRREVVGRYESASHLASF